MVPRPTLTRGFLWGAALLFLLDHAVTWAAASYGAGIPWGRFLTHWDAAWYNSIITTGYGGRNWAFFPLWPLVVKGCQFLSGARLAPHWIGTGLATLLFLGFVAWVGRAVNTGRPDPAGLTPATPVAWLLLLYSPASYVFHSHHTESLFLFLTFGAFMFHARQAVVPAAVLAGLAALTRLQGAFAVVAIFAALLLEARPLGQRLRTSCTFAAIAGGLALLYPLYQYGQTGNPLQFMAPQVEWSHPTSTLPIYLRAFVFGNPWQNLRVGSILHHAFFAALLYALWRLRSVPRSLFIYVALCLIILPMKGEFIDIFRYGAVLFPALFAIGARVDAWTCPWMRWGFVGGWIVLNHLVAVCYVLNRWAY